MDNPLIKIEDLTVSFGPQPVVGPLTLDIHQGETLAIVGESGSGKSLTALSLLKLLPKTARLQGKVLFQQQLQAQELKKDQTIPGHFSIQHPSIDILSLGPEALQLVRGRQIAMIFQEPMTSLNPVKTCGSQVAEALLLHTQISQQQARQQVIQLFTDVQLPDPESVFDRYPHQISGGQKQRVMIAMAMSCKPELLICD
ncbi:MAG TPA: ATP-binding cassette domain-containing protein, partial [Arachidicoccus sp.]|nr:ATP-binding cassette domain-containing protein [Arachidicoccus sp.]